MRSYFLYELRNRGGSIIGWGLGVSFFVVMYSLFYPSLPTEFTEADLTDNQMYQAFGNFEMGSYEAYFGSIILNFVALIPAIFAVANGTGALAGEEENGTLELMVTLPLHRWQIVVSKALAMAVSAFLILLMAAMGAVVAVIVVSGQTEVTAAPVDVILPVMSALPILLVIMMISLFFSAALPQRRYAAGAATLVVIGSFLGNNLLPQIEGTDAITALLPFHYYERSLAVITDGIRVGDGLILLAAALVFLLLAVWSFSQRNITTGMWLWQKGKPA